MQDHQHAGHSTNGGGPASTGNGSTPVVTCGAHGTMRTGGTCRQCQATGNASIGALGRGTAGQQIIAQADAGTPTGRIGHVHAGIAAHLLSEARTAEGQAFAGEYDGAAQTLVRELKELDGPA